MKRMKSFIGVAAFSVSSAALLITLLCCFSTPVDGGLFRSGLPTANDVKDSVKEDEYEKLESKTDLIKGYIRVLLENLF